jgi:ferredoxin
MKKLRLSLDALAVESFRTEDSARRWAGTVEAHRANTDASNCATCDTCPDNCPVPT